MKKLIILVLATIAITSQINAKPSARRAGVHKSKPHIARQNPKQAAVQTWPQVSERDAIAAVINQINQQSFYQAIAIKEQFAGMGRSSAFDLMLAQAESNRKNAITQYLKQLATPISYQVYQEMLAAGQL